MTIIMVFVSFFVLQLLLNAVFFRNYYVEREIASIESALATLQEELTSLEEDYFHPLYDFSNDVSAYTLILDNSMELIVHEDTDYRLTLRDVETNVIYHAEVDVFLYDFSIDEVLDFTLQEENGSYIVKSLTVNNEFIFSQECVGSCIEIIAQVEDVERPFTLNHLISQTPWVDAELQRLNDGEFTLESYTQPYGYHYVVDDTMVFLHHVNDQYLFTVVQMQDTQNIISIVYAYQNYVYLTAVVIIILWSFRIGTIVSKPIKNIEKIAREIADLNFDVVSNEYHNKESSSLSNSINLIAINLKQTIETINRKNAELVALYDDQTKQSNLKKQLVSSISHELKTPLMIMQVTVQGILDDIIPEKEQKKELENLLDEINKSSLMIQDMLQIYRLEDKENQLDLTPINLSETTKYFVNDFNTTFKNYGLQIQVNIEENVYISGEDKLIKRVLSNFITNAIKYTPEKETITINVYTKNRMSHFEIINSGVFIDKSEIKNIWLPFYRLENTQESKIGSRGSGIGLFLVSEILKAHEYDFDIVNSNDGVMAYFSAPIGDPSH